MYHSVYFGEKNSWDDWYLIPTERPSLTPPPVKTSYVEIPGADGYLDFTEALLKRPTYGNREGEIEFIIHNDHPNTWSQLYSEISEYLHGRAMNCYLEDDPDYYYHGRFAVNAWKSDQNWSLITINYNVLPYKFKKLTGVSGWTYSPFEHGNGVLNDYREFTVGATGHVETFEAKSRWIRPVFTVSLTSGDVMVVGNSIDGTTHQIARLQNGINSDTNIILKPGSNVLSFTTGQGKVILDCRGGVL